MDANNSRNSNGMNENVEEDTGMNCANHPDRERVAFCQHCGKPLCADCVRNVGTQVFCEPCLAARVAGTAPPHTAYGYPPPPNYTSGYQPGYQPGYPPAGPPVASGEPNPGLAALLGFIPGVGAMYNEQYAKGIVHLVVFAVLVSLASDVNGIFGLFIAGWVFYMAIEAYHTAKARRDGTLLPNPFGLNDLSERLGFGKGVARRCPARRRRCPRPAPGAAYTPPVTGRSAESRRIRRPAHTRRPTPTATFRRPNSGPRRRTQPRMLFRPCRRFLRCLGSQIQTSHTTTGFRPRRSG